MSAKKIAMIQDKAGCRLVWLDQPGNDDLQTIQTFPNRVAMKQSAPRIAVQLGAELYNRKRSGNLVLIERKQPKLSPTQQAALELAKVNGGKLCRYIGGCWMKPGMEYATKPDLLKRDTWHNTPTIQAMIDKGVFKPSAFRANSLGTFCTEVTISEQP